MLNNLFTILNNEPEKRSAIDSRRPFLHMKPKKGTVTAKNPDDLTDVRRMLNAKNDNDFRNIVVDIYSKWNAVKLSALLTRCEQHELEYPSHQNRIAIQVFKEILQSKELSHG